MAAEAGRRCRPPYPLLATCGVPICLARTARAETPQAARPPARPLPDAAQLISRYHLDRAESPQYGINTRLMRKVGGRWVIALNHVSSSETPDPNDPVEAHRP